MKVNAKTVCNYGIIDYSLITFFQNQNVRILFFKIGDYISSTDTEIEID